MRRDALTACSSALYLGVVAASGVVLLYRGVTGCRVPRAAPAARRRVNIVVKRTSCSRNGRCMNGNVLGNRTPKTT
jgi:hypothetical protein